MCVCVRGHHDASFVPVLSCMKKKRRNVYLAPPGIDFMMDVRELDVAATSFTAKSS